MKTEQSHKLAHEIGIQQDTLNEWMEEFKLPLPEKYQRNALQVLKMVKDLKDKNCGFNTIQRQIQLDYPELKPGESESQYPQSPSQIQNGQQELNNYFSTLRNELLELGELAEKYAQANYTIGQMTIQMRQMQEENYRLQTQMKLLPTPAAYESMQERELTYKNLLQGLQQRIRSLEEQVRELSGPQDRNLQSLPELPPAEPDQRQLKLPFEAQ